MMTYNIQEDLEISKSTFHFSVTVAFTHTHTEYLLCTNYLIKIQNLTISNRNYTVAHYYRTTFLISAFTAYQQIGNIPIF